jgi:hypothetical protein
MEATRRRRQAARDTRPTEEETAALQAAGLDFVTDGLEAVAVSLESDAASARPSQGNRIRPRNWGFTTYLDRVFGMRCFEDLVRLRVFPDAKDISESYGVIQAAIRQGMLLSPPGTAAATTGGGEPQPPPTLGKKATARRARDAERQRGVLCISIGDGSTPRTACLAAYLTAWQCVSVDPALREEWAADSPRGVGRLTGVSAPFEDFMQQHDALEAIRAAVEVDGGRGSVEHLVLLCVHAHHRFQGPACMDAVRQAFGDPPTTCVALPCCPTFNPMKDIGRAPDTSFEVRNAFLDFLGFSISVLKVTI